MVATIVRNKGEESEAVTRELIVLWVLTFVVDFFMLQPLVVLVRWSAHNRYFDPSWAFSQQINSELAQHLYSLGL